MAYNLVIFASGSGSNAENVVHYFFNHPTIHVQAVFCNNAQAGVIQKMESLHIPVVLFNRTEFNDPAFLLKTLDRFKPNLICLLGFLWRVPAFLVDSYPQKILNLHPALLPKFGGKGMYGHHVHEAVIKAGESQSGISIHWVNEEFDEGEMIAQYAFDIEKDDDATKIAHKVHLLEQAHVPATIEKVLMGS